MSTPISLSCASTSVAWTESGWIGLPRPRRGRSCGRRRNAFTPWRAIRRRLPNPARAHLLDLVMAADPVQGRNVAWEYVQAGLGRPAARDAG